MLEDQYWEPPQAVTRKTLLNNYDREIDKRIIHTGKRIKNKTLGQADACIVIERLVNRIINSQHLPYAIRHEPNSFRPLHETPLGEQLRDAISLLGLFDSYHDYSEHVTAFLDACWMLSSMQGIDLNMVKHTDFEPDIYYAEAMNDIAQLVRHHGSSEWFRRMNSDRRWEANTKADTIGGYTASVLQYYASITNVRVNFGYSQLDQSKLTIDEVFSHLDQLLYLKDWHPLFQHLVGYVWCVEQGERKGFHIHASFMFNGSEMSGDVNMGFMLLRLWEQITQGAGITDICNANLDRYDPAKIGIGYILRSDAQSCFNAINANRYLAKDTQYLRMKPKSARAFGYGMAPDVTTKRGRPVIQPPTWVYSDAFQRCSQ